MTQFMMNISSTAIEIVLKQSFTTIKVEEDYGGIQKECRTWIHY